MNDPLKEECKAGCQQPGQEITSEGSEAGLRPGAGVTCRDNISVGKLRIYLFNLKDGLDVDPSIQRHILEGCPSCDLRRRQLEATTPYLQGWLEPKFMAKEEMPPRPASAVRRERQPEERNPVQTGPGVVPAESPGLPGSSTEDMCRKLAKLLSSPAEPLDINLLEQWNRHLRLIEPPAERAAFTQEIVAQCEGRWHRMDSRWQAVAKTAAELLFTDLLGGATRFVPDESFERGAKHDVRRLPAELAGEAAERAFLVYMMARGWFLNAEGESVWGLAESGSGEHHVVLYFDVLRKALRMSSDTKGVRGAFQDRV